MRDGRASIAVARGQTLLLVSALALLLAGITALSLGLSGRFLPHDERYLGMTATDLCALHGCRVVHFMVHDRIAFGGALMAVALLYLWLIESPLQKGEKWAWWALLVSGVEGFGSFFAYLGYGYLDTWHGLATIGLLPCFGLGLLSSYRALPSAGLRSLMRPSVGCHYRSRPGVGRACLLMVAMGLVGAGATILSVGMTCVFVPQDLAFIGVTAEELRALNPRLVPLIAHDRAGFGGAVLCAGVVLFCCVWCGLPSRGLWRVLALAGLVGFGSAIGAHPFVGYTDPVHLGPAVLGAAIFFTGLGLTYRPAAPRAALPEIGHLVQVPAPVPLAVVGPSTLRDKAATR